MESEGESSDDRNENTDISKEKRKILSEFFVFKYVGKLCADCFD
jgi:hypothetical protein